MVRGEVRLVLRDVNTGEITQEIEGHNYVTEDQLNRMAACVYDVNDYGGSNENRFGQYIFIGGLDQEHDRGWNQMWKVYERGTTETGITSPELLYGPVGTGGTNARWYQYQQRFSPPAATRDIWTIGINRSDNTTVPSNNVPLYVSAYIVLNTPCVQTTTETLDVFYRIIWDNPDEGTSDLVPSGNMMYAISLRHFYGNAQYVYYPYNSKFFYHGRKMTPNIRNQWIHEGGRGQGEPDGQYNTNPDLWGLGGLAYADTAYRARIMYAQSQLTQSLGFVVGSIGHTGVRNIGDEQEICIATNPTVPPTESPIQNIFSHSAAATGPFYAAATVPAGNGTLAFDGDSWTDPDYQKLMRIQITGTGGVGVGTYQLWMRNITGFINNTYNDGIVAVPFINAYNNWHGTWFENGASDTGSGRIWDRRSFTERVGNMAMSYDGVSKIVAWTHYMIIKQDVLTNERIAFRSDTTPGFTFANAADIGQVLVADNGDIWAADAMNGLYRIHADDSAIDEIDNTHVDLTGISSSACYGVAKTPGRIWAIMHDSLIWTNDNGASFTVYDSTTTPAFNLAPVGEETRYWFLHGDPTHADHRLAVGYNNNTTFGNIGVETRLHIKWWDSVSGNGATTPELTRLYSDTNLGGSSNGPNRRRECFQFFHCSPNDGWWGSRRSYQAATPDDDNAALWAFGSTNPTYNFSVGDYDSWVSSGWIFWWTKDSNGNDAMLLTSGYSNQYRWIMCQTDGTAHYPAYMNDDYDPPYAAASMSGYTNGFRYSMKAFFPESGMFLCSGRQSSSGNRNWYLVSVSDNVNSDAGPFINTTWKRYGWDGANWVEGNTNSKTIHATDDALIDGLTVSFDDDSGTQTFVDTDYYTVGVIDGVLLDGGTEFDSRYALYYKPVDFHRTEVEGGGTLPATTSVAARGLNTSEMTVMLDNTNTTYESSNNRFRGTTTGAWSARLHGSFDDQAYFLSRWIQGFGAGVRMVVGFADASKIGGAVSETNIDYGVRFSVPVADNDNNFSVEVISNGTVVHVEHAYNTNDAAYREGEFNGAQENHQYVRFHRKQGETDLEVRVRNKIIYTFTGVTASLVPCFWKNTNQGYFYHNSMTKTYTDYHVELGDSGTTVGKFDPNFWAIDWTLPGRPTLDEVKIDGTPVTSILVNDYGRTTLAAGEIEVLTYQGKVRYSAADVGKTLTFDRYNVILHE